jgi:hypothetical protein
MLRVPVFPVVGALPVLSVVGALPIIRTFLIRALPLIGTLQTSGVPGMQLNHIDID